MDTERIYTGRVQDTNYLSKLTKMTFSIRFRQNIGYQLSNDVLLTRAKRTKLDRISVAVA